MTDPIVVAAQFLRAQLSWLRGAVDEMGQPYAVAVFAEIADCARVLRSTVDGPREQRYLGPCGADLISTGIDAEGWPTDVDIKPCEGDVYGPAGGDKGTCRTCGAQVDQGERRKWLDEEVRDRAFRLSHIADAYRIPLKTLRDWAADRPEVRAPNGAVVRSAKPAKLHVHGHDWEGKQLFLVGDVLDLAAQAAAKRAENEARRARRVGAEMGA